MHNDQGLSRAILETQLNTFARATATGLFRLNLGDGDRLDSLSHPDNWLVIDPELIGLPPTSSPTIEQLLGIFQLDPEAFIDDVNDYLAAKHPHALFVRTTLLDPADDNSPWLELKISVERDSDGRHCCLHGRVSDKSEEHALQTGLRDLGEFLNNILLEVPVAIFRLDLTNENTEIFDYASVSGNWMINASALYGLPKNTVKSPTDSLNYMHPEDRQRVSSRFNEARENGEPAYEVEYRTIWPDGSLHWLASKSFFEFDRDGRLIALNGIQYDITTSKRQQEQIEFLAGHDTLTKLANRSLFMETLERTLAAGRRYGRPFAVIYLDLDNFKGINDTLGHSAGDELLVEVSHRFRSVLRASEFVARLGGDEFVILADGFSESSQVEVIAKRLLAAVADPVSIQDRRCRVTVSLGISVFPDHGEAGDTLMKYADIALYMAKEAGKNRYRFYDPEKAAAFLDQRQTAESGVFAPD